MNKINIFKKVELYIVSLSILFAFVFILTVDVPIDFSKDAKFIGFNQLLKTNYMAILSLLFFILSIVFSWRFDNVIKGAPDTPSKIELIENINFEHLTFLATYVIPLISFDLSKPRFSIVLILLLILIGVIYVKTHLFYSNPSLALLGYKIYRVNLKNSFRSEDSIIIITKDELFKDDLIETMTLDIKIKFGRKSK